MKPTKHCPNPTLVYEIIRVYSSLIRIMSSNLFKGKLCPRIISGLKRKKKFTSVFPPIFFSTTWLLLHKAIARVYCEGNNKQNLLSLSQFFAYMRKSQQNKWQDLLVFTLYSVSSLIQTRRVLNFTPVFLSHSPFSFKLKRLRRDFHNTTQKGSFKFQLLYFCPSSISH
jgi:hypothetical protein